MSKLEDALWDADAALKKLKPQQGCIARRNAREVMLKALRKTRAALDEEYPITRRTVRRRRKNRTPGQQQKGKLVLSNLDALLLLQAGISSRYIIELPQGRGKAFWAPWWMARALGTDIPVKSIAAAVRDLKQRRRIMATLWLKGV